jgi:hypothetical protein
MKDHTLYLKALAKGSKVKPIESETFRRYLELLTKEYAPHGKPLSKVEDEKAGRKFILENLEDFLNYSVEFSLADRLNDLWSDIPSK